MRHKPPESYKFANKAAYLKAWYQYLIKKYGHDVRKMKGPHD